MSPVGTGCRQTKRLLSPPVLPGRTEGCDGSPVRRELGSHRRTRRPEDLGADGPDRRGDVPTYHDLLKDVLLGTGTGKVGGVFLGPGTSTGTR